MATRLLSLPERVARGRTPPRAAVASSVPSWQTRASFTWASSSRSSAPRLQTRTPSARSKRGRRSGDEPEPRHDDAEHTLGLHLNLLRGLSVATAPFAPRTIAIGPCGAVGPAPEPPPAEVGETTPGVKPWTLSAPPNSGTAAGPEARRPTAAATVPPTTIPSAAMSPPGAPRPQSPNGGTVLVLRLEGEHPSGGTPPPAGGATRHPAGPSPKEVTTRRRRRRGRGRARRCPARLLRHPLRERAGVGVILRVADVVERMTASRSIIPCCAPWYPPRSVVPPWMCLARAGAWPRGWHARRDGSRRARRG